MLRMANSSFKSQVINCFDVFVTIITSKIVSCLMFVLQLLFQIDHKFTNSEYLVSEMADKLSFEF